MCLITYFQFIKGTVPIFTVNVCSPNIYSQCMQFQQPIYWITYLVQQGSVPIWWRGTALPKLQFYTIFQYLQSMSICKMHKHNMNVLSNKTNVNGLSNRQFEWPHFKRVRQRIMLAHKFHSTHVYISKYTYTGVSVYVDLMTYMQQPHK